jgi:hypothetical protein
MASISLAKETRMTITLTRSALRPFCLHLFRHMYVFKPSQSAIIIPMGNRAPSRLGVSLEPCSGEFHGTAQIRRFG